MTHYMYADIYEPEDGEDFDSEDEELQGMGRGSTAGHSLSPSFFFAVTFKKRPRWLFEDTEGLLYTF